MMYQPPYSNTGALRTIESLLGLCVDWLEGTLKNVHIVHFFYPKTERIFLVTKICSLPKKGGSLISWGGPSQGGTP